MPQHQKGGGRTSFIPLFLVRLQRHKSYPDIHGRDDDQEVWNILFLCNRKDNNEKQSQDKTKIEVIEAILQIKQWSLSTIQMTLPTTQYIIYQ